MAAGDLTTLDAVKAWLRLDAGLTSDDVLLAGLITAASDFIGTWCSRAFAVQEHTEIRDGTGGRKLVLANNPVIAVVSLTIDDQLIPAGSPGYQITPTALILTGTGFSRGMGNVVVRYTAGFATIPPALAQACVELVGWRYREMERIGKSSEGLAGQTTGYRIADMPPSVATILNPYRKVVPV